MAGGEGMGWKGTLGIALFVPAVVGLVAPVALRAQGLGLRRCPRTASGSLRRPLRSRGPTCSDASLRTEPWG